MSLVGMLCVLTFYKMPDTKGKPIPDTMADIMQQELVFKTSVFKLKTTLFCKFYFFLSFINFIYQKTSV